MGPGMGGTLGHPHPSPTGFFWRKSDALAPNSDPPLPHRVLVSVIWWWPSSVLGPEAKGPPLEAQLMPHEHLPECPSSS